MIINNFKQGNMKKPLVLFLSITLNVFLTAIILANYSYQDQLKKQISEQKSYILGLEQIIKRENNRIERNTDSIEIKNAIKMGIIINQSIIQKSRGKCK